MSKRKNTRVLTVNNTDAYNELGVHLEMIAAILDLVHDRLQSVDADSCGSVVFAAMTLTRQADELYGQL